jgi:hypothetical protein
MEPSGAISTDTRLGFPVSEVTTPKAVEADLSLSVNRSYEYSALSLNTLLSALLSKLTPAITQFLSVNSWILSRNPLPSIVQPGVSAFGYHHNSAYFPEKSPNDTVVPSWFVNEKSGALLPSAIMLLFHLNIFNKTLA